MSGDEETSTSNDLIAGWLGGAFGIVVSNPLEVLKVRLQTHPTDSSKTPRVGAGSRPPSALAPSSSSTSTARHHIPSPTPPPISISATAAASAVPRKPSLTSLWRAEGLRVFFAGAMGPILGLAFIDSAFFGGYGVAMNALHQNRQDPDSLGRVFLAGGVSGATCALLQTPIEVVKCRAQFETLPSSAARLSSSSLLSSPYHSPSSKYTPGAPPQKLGSYGIALKIAKEQGLKGFYVGGLMTACRDGLSSGVFFWGYFVFRRILRGERPFQPSGVPEALLLDNPPSHRIDKREVLRMFLAGGLAGSLSAFVPYPFDIVKTRLQTTVASLTHPSPLTIVHQIHSEGHLATQYRYTSSLLYSVLSTWIYPPRPGTGRMVDGRFGGGGDPRAEKWARRLGAYGAFFRGLGPTLVGSFVGSAVTITTFEVALMFLAGDGLW